MSFFVVVVVVVVICVYVDQKNPEKKKYLRAFT